MPIPICTISVHEQRLSAKSNHLYNTANLFKASTAFYFFNCDRVISSANPQICHGPILPFLKVL